MLVLLYVLFVIGVYYIIAFYLKVRKYPKGPLPLPIIGNVHQIDFQTFHLQLIEMAKQYGPVFTVWLPEPHVFVSDYDHLKEVFVKHGDITSGRGLTLADRFFIPNESPGIVGSEGEKWLLQRRTCIGILRDLGMGKNKMNEMVTLSINQSLDYMESLGEEQLKAFDPSQMIQIYTGAVLNKLLFGITYSNENGDRLIRLLKIIEENAILLRTSPRVGILAAFPWIEHIPIVGELMTNTFKQHVKHVLDAVHEDVTASIKNYNVNDEPECVAQGYYQKMQKDSRLGMTELLECAADFFFAGMDTTASTIRWAILHLANNQDMQAKIRQEIQSSIGNRLPTVSDRSSLHYTNAFITEVQRLASIVPINLIHRTTDDVILSDYKIPSNTRLIGQIDTVMRTSEVFENPSEFNPDRFLMEDGRTLNKKTVEQVLPFSLGKRQCPGEGLARLEIFLAVTIFVQKYKIEPSNRQKIDLSCDFAFILHTKSQKLKFTAVV